MNRLIATCGGSLFGTMLVFRRVLGAATRKRIIGTAPWNRIAGAAFVTHLRRQAAHPMLVEQVTQRAYGHLQKLRCVRLISFSAAQSLEQISFLKLIEMRGQVEALFGKVKSGRDPWLAVIGN